MKAKANFCINCEEQVIFVKGRCRGCNGKHNEVVPASHRTELPFDFGVMEKTKVKFNACEHLDFSDNYNAEKALIAFYDTTKVCWDRPVIDDSYPRLVQFCKKRGRLNHPESCLCEKNKQCSDYKDIEHIVELMVKAV